MAIVSTDRMYLLLTSDLEPLQPFSDLQMAHWLASCSGAVMDPRCGFLSPASRTYTKSACNGCQPLMVLRIPAQSTLNSLCCSVHPHQ